MDSSSSSRRTLQRLEAKLKYKLGCINQCLNRLTEACNSQLLDKSAHLKLLNSIILNGNSEDNLDDFLEKDFDERALEIEISNLNEYTTSDAAAQKECDFYHDGEVVRRAILNNSTYGVFGMDTGYYSYSDNKSKEDALALDGLFSCTSSDKLPKNSTQMGTILTAHGRVMNNFESAAEFSEDIVASIEAEIDQHVDELRGDVPGIEKHVQDMKLMLAKDWLRLYADQCLEYKRNVDHEMISLIRLDEIE